MPILFIQPSVKYPDFPIAGRHQSVRQKEGYIEIGLLSVASFLRANDLDVMMLNMCDENTSVDDLISVLEKNKPEFIGISCMSGYSYHSMRDYAKIIKDINPNSYIITGGQHSGPLGKTVLEEIPYIDCVVRFAGEIPTWEVYNAVINKTTELETILGICFRSGSKIVCTEAINTAHDINAFPFLDYSLFSNAQKYVPRLEESRGCPFDCWFCSNGAVFTKKVVYKSVDRLIDELKNIHTSYGNPDILNFYLIAKNYGLDETITVEFAKRVKKLPFKVEWRTQTSIDVFNPDILPLLSDSGLRVIDFGLESASSQMLTLMNKTSGRPDFYLKKAEEILRKSANVSNTLIKLNILFYPGETPETLAETLEFLFRWKHLISAVTASPAMIDPGAPIWQRMEYFEKRFGTTLIKNDYWDSIHIYPVNPSRDLTFEQTNTISMLITKMFQSKKDYFLTRKFGGLSSSVSIDEFEKSMLDIPSALRPYSDK